jgi:hypothetical protein
VLEVVVVVGVVIVVDGVDGDGKPSGRSVAANNEHVRKPKNWMQN